MKDVPAHRSPGATGWTAGAQGPGPRAQGAGWTCLWRQNRGQADRSGAPAGEGGAHGPTWDWLAVVRQDEVIQAHNATWAGVPSEQYLRAREAAQGAPQHPLPSPALLPPAPPPRLLLSMSLDTVSGHCPPTAPREGL